MTRCYFKICSSWGGAANPLNTSLQTFSVAVKLALGLDNERRWKYGVWCEGKLQKPYLGRLRRGGVYDRGEKS